MKPSQVIRFGIAAAVLVLLLAACVHPSDSGSSASGSSSGSSTSGSVTSPAIEPTTGLESPGSPTGNPSISMPSVPAGNDGADKSCVRANWLGNPIPPGDIVAITSVAVDPPFTFDPAATANCGSPSCVNYQFSAANDSEPFCYIGVGNENGSVSNDGTDTAGHLTLSAVSSVHRRSAPRAASMMQRPCKVGAAAGLSSIWV